MLKKASVGQRGEVEHTKAEQLVMARLRSPFIAKLNYSFQNGIHFHFIFIILFTKRNVFID